MSAARQRVDPPAAVAPFLAETEEMLGPAVAAYLCDGVLGVEQAQGYGAALQHLRNRVVGFVLGRALPEQPVAGTDGRTWRAAREFIVRLDGALLELYALPDRAPRRDRGKKKRALLLIDHLPARNRIYSHTRQICTYAAALALDRDVEDILVLVTQETAPESPLHALSELEPEHEGGWRAELEEVAGGPAPKVRFETVARVGAVRPYEASIARAVAFDPDIIFAFQGMFRSRLLPDLLHPRAAIVAVQMNATNVEPPLSDLVLAHGHSVDFSAQPTPAKWRNHAVPIIAFPKEQTIDPEDLGPESPLRIVTVLTLGRLEKGLMLNDARSLRFVVSFLEDHPEAVWLMVAIEDPAAFAEVIAPHLTPDVAERLRLLPVVPDLRAIYEHCHIYMHLPNLGGGNMGMVMAVAEGVPVVAREGSDGANTLCEGQTYTTPAHAARILRRLADDPDLRSKRATRQRRKVDRDHSLNTSAGVLKVFVAEALADFESRRAP